jgi:hypothetical protein
VEGEHSEGAVVRGLDDLVGVASGQVDPVPVADDLGEQLLGVGGQRAEFGVVLLG